MQWGGMLPACWDFNPRSPRGERRKQIPVLRSASKFQSTLPSRGATSIIASDKGSDMISIHAPLAGSDVTARKGAQLVIDFNPRSPRGERPA